MSEALARSGRHGVEELGGILNAWFDAMNERIRTYGGSLAEFAGDALIAVFGGGGAPARPAAARRAVQCALDMQADMARFQPVPTRAVGAEHHARENEVIATDELVEPGSGNELVECSRRGWLVPGGASSGRAGAPGRAAVPRPG